MIYLCDIDNTICKTKGEDYENAKPYLNRIKKMNKLYDKGHTIIYKTARGDMSGKNWMPLTRQQLKEWGVKYKTVGEKQYGDVIIDDRAINSSDFFK
jgi:hypothetical protein